MSERYSLEKYKFIKTIGEGTFGKVKLALHKLTEEQVAIKILEKKKIKNQKDYERIEKEIKYMKMLNHPNIVKIYEIIEDENNYYIVMEYVSGGELFNYIVKNKRLEENEASFFYSQIVHIIQEIHKHKICHRDLKPENLLLTQNKTIKLIDFGLSNQYNIYLNTPCGSPCYASPEVIRGWKYSGLAIDLWASGIILYSMLCGYLPFDDKNNDKLFRKILECKIDFPTKKNIIISESGKDLIKKILRKDPAKRITLDEILEHPFLSYGNKKYKERINMEINKQDKLIIDYMINIMKIPNNNDKIKTDIMNNKHNNNTTIFNLLKKKYNEGRLNYNILQKKDTDSSNRSKILKRFNQNKLNRTINTESNFINNENLFQNIKNIIKKKVNENNNNIIIINNNNNLVNQPHKMNYILNSILTDNKDINKVKYERLKKIDTSVSIEKNKKDNQRINISHSPGIEPYKPNAFKYNSKIKENRVFYKKYINTSLNQNHNNINQNDSTLKTDSFNMHLRKPSNDKKNLNLNFNGYNEYKKKVIPPSHLKALTNLQYYTLNNTKDNQYNTRISLKNKSLINSLIYNKNEFKKKLNSSIAKRNTEHLGFYCRSPDNKIYAKYSNYFKNINDDTLGNNIKNDNPDKLNDTNKNANTIGEIKKEINQDNNSIRNSMIPKENINNQLFATLNSEEDNSTLDLNKKKLNKVSIKKIIQIGNDNYYRKLNPNRVRDERRKIRVNKLITINNDKQYNNNTFDVNNNLSERERYPKAIYINKTINNDSNHADNKRLKFSIKENTEKKQFNNILAYSKKICSQNKSFAKNNTNFYMINTRLSMNEICKRINEFCSKYKLFYHQTNDKYTIIINEVHSVTIEINPSEGGYLLKFSHENGDEKKTKEYIIPLYYEIAI